KITTVRNGAKRLVEVVCDSVDGITQALAMLERRDGVLELAARLKQLEHEADRVHQDAIVELFDQEKDPIVVIKWKEIFDFLEAATCGTAVASTIGKGMIDINIVTPTVIFGGLAGAIVWDLFTWWIGLPTSSSHALVGGYAGAAIAKAGWSSLIPSGWTKTLIFIVVAPILGMVLALAISLVTMSIFQNFSPRRVDHWFRRLQLLLAAAYSLGHGSN